MTTDRMLRLKAVQEIVPFSRSKIYQLIADGRFPAPQKVEGCSIWWESQVLAWRDRQRCEATVGGR